MPPSSLFVYVAIQPIVAGMMSNAIVFRVYVMLHSQAAQCFFFKTISGLRFEWILFHQQER